MTIAEHPEQSICQELSQRLNTCFRLWHEVDSSSNGEVSTWYCEETNPPPCSNAGDVASANQLPRQLLSEAHSTGSSLTHRCQNGRVALIVPITTSKVTASCAVGFVDPDPMTLLGSLGDSVSSEVTGSHRLAEQSSHVAMFTDRLSTKLEELAFLRRLAENLEFSTAQNTLEDVALGTFQSLRGVVRAESIALVREGGLPQSNGRDYPVWIGDERGDENELNRFLGYATSVAGRHPFVWNAGGVKDRIPPSLIPNGVRSCILVRIQNTMHNYGWLMALNKIDDADPTLDNVNNRLTLGLDEFGTIEASLLEAAAGLLATHAANRRLFLDQRELTVSVIRSLINVVDARDRYTCGHSDRVALMARELAAAYGRPIEAQEDIYLSGLLHDIGKVAVPDHVLLKAGKLTDEEFEIIKQHPERGVEILKHIKQLDSVLPGVLHHHESIDGSGYPGGLVGDDIPEMGRMLAVVDAFDAMTTTRPYREARTKQEALGILMSGSGQQWDSRFVECFVENYDRITGTSRDWETHIAEVLNPSNDGELTENAPGP